VTSVTLAIQSSVASSKPCCAPTSLTFVVVAHCTDLNASSAERAQLAAAEGTWSFDQYAVRVLCSMGYDDTTTSKFVLTTGLFGSGKPYWQFPRYTYREGFDLHDLVRCKAGDWQDDSVPYETGPQFLKKHPKESWTLRDVAYEGGHGGAERWF